MTKQFAACQNVKCAMFGQHVPIKYGVTARCGLCLSESRVYAELPKYQPGTDEHGYSCRALWHCILDSPSTRRSDR